jgi:hypothetical protein
MRHRLNMTSALASVLPSCRLALLFAGALLLGENAVVGVALVVAAIFSLAASVVLGALLYRA